MVLISHQRVSVCTNLRTVATAIFVGRQKGGQKPMGTSSQKSLVHRREDAAQRLGVSVRTVDELIATKKIPTVKIGRRRLISEKSLQRFIDQNESD
jgi:excisionase family DNA binding protein